MRLALISLAACGSVWPDIPGDETSFAEPAIVGKKLVEGSVYRATLLYARMASDGLCVLVHEDAGSSPDGASQLEESVRVFAAGHELPTLPSPKGAFLATRLDDVGCVAVTDGGVSVLVGGSWMTVALPTGVVDAEADVQQVVASPAQIGLVTSDSRLFVWSSGAWSSPMMQADLRIGAADASGLRVVYTTPDNITTAAYSWSLAPLGAAADLLSSGPARGVQVNGSVDDFYFAGSLLELEWFHAGAFTAVGEANFILQAPGGHRIVALDGAPTGNIPGGTIWENGVSLGAAFPSAEPAISCGCSVETDPTCTCVGHGVTFVPAVSSDASKVGLVTASDLNGHRIIYSNELALPLTTWF